MKIYKLLSLIIIFLGIGLFLGKNAFAQLSLPVISTACESRNGNLSAFEDGFSMLKKCDGDSRRVVLIGEKGDKGEPGERGEKGEQGSQGIPGPIPFMGIGSTGAIFMNDSAGSSLGFAIVPHIMSFHDRLQRFIHVNIENNNEAYLDRISVFFESNDCTGTPYKNVPDGGMLNHDANELLSSGIGYYYSLSHDALKNEITYNSVQHEAPEHIVICEQNTNTINDARRLNRITSEYHLTFTEPLKLPFRYEYQIIHMY